MTGIAKLIFGVSTILYFRYTPENDKQNLAKWHYKETMLVLAIASFLFVIFHSFRTFF